MFEMLQVYQDESEHTSAHAKALAESMVIKNMSIAEMDHIKSVIDLPPVAGGSMPQLENKGRYLVAQRIVSPKKGQKSQRLLDGKSVKALVDAPASGSLKDRRGTAVGKAQATFETKRVAIANIQGAGSLVDQRECEFRKTLNQVVKEYPEVTK